MKIIVRLFFSTIQLFLFVSFIFVTSLNGEACYQENPGTIKGKIIDKKTRAPLVNVNVTIIGTSLGTSTNSDGEYLFPNLSPGTYNLRFQCVGYLLQEVSNVSVTSEKELIIDIELEEKPYQLGDVVVTPGHYTIMGSGLQSRQILTSEEIQNVSFAEDIYRAVTRLPGIAASDFSAKFTIRGGEANEILVLFDGLQLYEPFHMKDLFGGALSIIDVNAIGGIDIMTGGFPSTYGDRMSGVFKITSKKPDPGTKNVSLGISLMNARFFSSGTFANDNGHWLVSARRGYIDVVLKMMDEKNTPSPKYYDIYAKGEYKLNDNHTFSINVLHAGDKFDFTEEDLDFENTHYNNSYIWLTLNSVMSQSMTARTVASFGEVNHLREGTGFLSQNVNDLDFRVKDDRGMKIGNINQDWIWNISKNNLLNWGFDAKFSSVQYDYSSLKVMYTLNANQQIVRVDNLNNIADKNLNNQYAVYLSNRIQITSPLTAEIGVRYDYSTLIRDGDLSPRVNIAYAIDKETFIRAGWGYFYQTQNLNELNIQDGDKRLFPAEKTENFGVGFEHYFGNGIHLRIEAYYKRLADLRPVYRNLFNPTEVFPEMNDDRVYVQLENARSKGIELFLKYDVGGKFSWWATYAYASSIERIKGISRDIPRPYDQKHTFCLDLNYRLTEDWNFSLAFQYHTGWPRTEKFYITVPLPTGGNVYTDKIGPYMGSKFPDYHRLDVRATRNFNTSIGKFSIFAELINLYSRDNIRSIEYRNPVYPPNGLAYYNTREFYWLPFLPSIGISWSLDM